MSALPVPTTPLLTDTDVAALVPWAAQLLDGPKRLRIYAAITDRVYAELLRRYPALELTAPYPPDLVQIAVYLAANAILVAAGKNPAEDVWGLLNEASKAAKALREYSSHTLQVTTIDERDPDKGSPAPTVISRPRRGW